MPSWRRTNELGRSMLGQAQELHIQGGDGLTRRRKGESVFTLGRTAMSHFLYKMAFTTRRAM